MMEKNAEIRFRENSDVKKKASVILASMGMDLSSALRMFLRQVVRTKSIPFRMESGYTTEGEEMILKAAEEHETDRKTGKVQTYSNAKEMLDDIDNRK